MAEEFSYLTFFFTPNMKHTDPRLTVFAHIVVSLSWSMMVVYHGRLERFLSTFPNPKGARQDIRLRWRERRSGCLDISALAIGRSTRSAARLVTSASSQKILPQSVVYKFCSNIFRQNCHRAAARFVTSDARSRSEIPMGRWGMSYAQVQLTAGLRHAPASCNDTQDKHPDSRHRSTSGEAVEHNSGGYPQGD
jgi:hypothetical protein